MRPIKTTLQTVILLASGLLSIQAWADTLNAERFDLKFVHQQSAQSQQRHAPTAADFERLNNQNKTQSKMQNKQPHGMSTAMEHQKRHTHRYGSGSSNRGGQSGGPGSGGQGFGKH